MIYEYVKNKYGHLKGVVCATDRNKIGWSLCHNNDIIENGFDKQYGVELAKNRAVGREKFGEIPRSIVNYYKKMEDRAKRYYKQ